MMKRKLKFTITTIRRKTVGSALNSRAVCPECNTEMEMPTAVESIDILDILKIEDPMLENLLADGNTPAGPRTGICRINTKL